jgi:biopolymer transport protein ExbD
MKFKRRKIRRGRVEIIPMIDTIVILLIFYMSFARVAEMSREAAIKLPETVAGDDMKQLPNQVVVNMFSSDDIRIGGQPLTIAELPDVLANQKRIVQQFLQQQDPLEQNPKVSLILRGSREMSYRDLSNFMRASAKAGIADVTFATLEAR